MVTTAIGAESVDALEENMSAVDLGGGESIEEALVLDAYKVHRTLSGDQSMSSEIADSSLGGKEEDFVQAAPAYKVGDKVFYHCDCRYVFLPLPGPLQCLLSRGSPLYGW